MKFQVLPPSELRAKSFAEKVIQCAAIQEEDFAMETSS
jgi:hypothetical protein